MTKAQWLWEYQALQKKEEERTNFAIDSLKAIEKMLVQLLGLDLLKEKDEDTIIPLSMLTGRREVVETMIEKIKQTSDAQQALDDEQFDAVSEAFARGEIVDDVGDMDPIIEKSMEVDRQKQLKLLGVKMVDGSPNAPHFSLNMEELREKVNEVKTSRLEHEKQVEEITKKSIKMTFDDEVNNG